MNAVRTREFHSFEQARDLIFEFEAVLNQQGIVIRTDSVLNSLCLQMVELYEKFTDPGLRTPEQGDARKIYRELVGLFDLVGNVVRASGRPAFKNLLSHLKLLNKGDPLQNRRTSLLDQDNNKLFELYIAALCMQASATDVEVDDPRSSKGNNPDVIATIDGVRWGFACKVAHTVGPQTIFGNIVKAVDQIERSPAHSGFPVLSAKNIIEHDAIWPSFDGAHLSFPTIEQPLNLLRAQALALKDSLVKELGLEELRNAFVGKKSQPACLVYLPSATSTVINCKPHPTRLNLLQLIQFDSMKSDAIRVVELLHEELQASGGAPRRQGPEAAARQLE